MKTFKFVISTPDGNLYDGDVVKVSLRGAEGDLAIMANHIPFVTSVKPCICRLELEDGKVTSFKVEDGLLSVTAESTTLLSGNAKLTEE